MNLNKAARRAYNNAIARGKITSDGGHEETVSSLAEELDELRRASETAPADHMHGRTEAVEELVDVLIGSMTELYRRGVDLEKAVHEKLSYNESRVQL